MSNKPATPAILSSFDCYLPHCCSPNLGAGRQSTPAQSAMPSYNYHLKFELYPTADPSVRTRHDSSVWIPSDGSSIFDDLPSHPRRHPAATKATRTQVLDYALPRVLDLSDPSSSSHSSTSTPADPAEESNNTVRLTERQWRARKESFPPPGFAVGLGPRTAARDWRFGRLSVESFDMDGHKKEDGHGVPAASLGPTFGGPGQSTKGRYIPLETKNTDVGWGIVHLYRESEGSSGAGDGLEEPARGEGAGSEEGNDGDDGTILCIPAVPSYLSPSDFLGFVGEKWRGDVSHYRMVMTSRMNRYMVLMKFRDKWRAQDWRKEFDGKVFNSMEVCFYPCPLGVLLWWC